MLPIPTNGVESTCLHPDLIKLWTSPPMTREEMASLKLPPVQNLDISSLKGNVNPSVISFPWDLPFLPSQSVLDESQAILYRLERDMDSSTSTNVLAVQIGSFGELFFYYYF